METIGLFEAKTHLSAIIEKVRNGESFTITHRGKPVAELRGCGEDHKKTRQTKRAEALHYFRHFERVKLPKGYTLKSMIEEGRQ